MPAAQINYMRSAGRKPSSFVAGSFDERLAQTSIRRLDAKEHVFCDGDERTVPPAPVTAACGHNECDMRRNSK